MSTDGTTPPSIAPQRPARGPVTTREEAPAPFVADRLAGGTARTGTATTPGAPAGPGPASAQGSAQAPTAVRGPVQGPSTPSPVPTGTAPTAKTSPAAASAAPATPAGPRRVRLAVARIDPWSVMKLGFLLSVAVGIMIVVAAAVVWYTLDNLAVFTTANDILATLAGEQADYDLLQYVEFGRVISLATMIAVVDIVLLTALSTIGAFLYNIVASLVGGIHLTLTDD